MVEPKDYLKTCHFRKHKGTPWEEVVIHDRSYVEWLISWSGPSLAKDLEEHLLELLEDL